MPPAPPIVNPTQSSLLLQMSLHGSTKSSSLEPGPMGPTGTMATVNGLRTSVLMLLYVAEGSAGQTENIQIYTTLYTKKVELIKLLKYNGNNPNPNPKP